MHESVQHFISITRRITRDRMGVDQADLPGIHVCWADSLFPFWNALFLTESIDHSEHLRETLQRCVAYMRSKTQPGLIYLCLDQLSDAAGSQLTSSLDALGLEKAFAARGMSCLLSQETAPSTPLRFARALDEKAMMHFADLNSVANGFSLEAGRAGLGNSTFWKSEAHTCIGYLQDEPVCCAAVTGNKGSLYVSLVSTHPSMRRQGFASAVVHHALRQAAAATGLARCTLHASEAGIPVYAKMGFRPSASFVALCPCAGFHSTP